VRAKRGCRLDSIVLARQIRCVDLARLVRRLGKLRPLTLAAVDRALLITLGLIDL